MAQVAQNTGGLLHGSTRADRAAIFAVVCLLSYSGATIPSLISARLSTTLSIPQLALGYGVLTLLATGLTVAAARNPHRATTGDVRHGELSAAARSSHG